MLNSASGTIKWNRLKSVRTSVEAAPLAQLGEQEREQIGEQEHEQVGEQVREQEREQVREQVCVNISEQGRPINPIRKSETKSI